MHILISNDDGIEADGIRALVSSLKDTAEITVAAPLYEKSGASQSLTVHSPLQIKEVVRNNEFLGYGINGSPADCIKIAVSKICKKAPDIVISGINRGPNNAFNIYYSGTVGAACEGAVLGIKSFAVSMSCYHYNKYDASAEFMKHFIKKIDMLPKDCMLYNINIPPVEYSEIKGVRFTKMALTSYLDNYASGKDPFGENYYWLSDFRKPFHVDKLTDDGALADGYVSITPVTLDRTDYKTLNEILSKGSVW